MAFIVDEETGDIECRQGDSGIYTLPMRWYIYGGGNG